MRDEIHLIRAAARGEVEAFEELVLLKRERVVRTAYQITGDLEDARDVAQGVFLTLWRSFGTYDPERRFDTWLYRITVNAAIDHLRRRGPGAALQPLPDTGAPGILRTGPGAEEALGREEIRNAFRHLAARLAPKQRVAFVLREIQGMDTAEVARVMDVSESTVRNHLFQARKVLRTGLRREFPGLVPRTDRGEDRS